MLTKLINIERLIHSTKTVIACFLGLLLARAIGLAGEQWVIITIIVVMCAQIYVGSVMQKAYLRFLGTVVGCLFAALTITFMGDSPLAIGIAIGLSSFIFSYIATKSENYTYAATLGAVTTAIIMLGQVPTLLFAFERFLEISIGIFIAALVSQFVLPIHASTHLRRAQGKTLALLKNYYQEAMIHCFTKEQEVDYLELDENIVQTLLKQRQLAKESHRERFALAFDTTHFMQSLYSEREILRAITFMHSALTHLQTALPIFTQSAAAQTFNEKILQSLDVLIKTMESNEITTQFMPIPSTIEFKEEIERHTYTIMPEEMLYVDGFLFSADTLTTRLAALAHLYRIQVIDHHPDSPELSL
jgi:uncharacterized membrane protein YccC